MFLLINLHDIASSLLLFFIWVVAILVCIGFCVWLQKVGTDNFDLEIEAEALRKYPTCCGRCDGGWDICVYEMDEEEREAQLKHTQKLRDEYVQNRR